MASKNNNGKPTDRILTRENLYQLNAQPTDKEVCHLARPFERIIQEVGMNGIIYLYDLAIAYPEFPPYCLDHHFHEDGTENIVLDTAVFEVYPKLFDALLRDCRFSVKSFIKQDKDGVARPTSVRERAAELMGKIKEIDEKDTLRILDPELYELKRK